MNIRPTTLAILAAALAAATAAGAATGLDADGDGLVTLEELTAALPDVTEETFTAMDANGDGTLDTDELAEARDAGMIPAMDG